MKVMVEPTSFSDWMARLRAGDETAAAEVFQRFTRRLIGLARSHLDTWIRRKEDPDDIVQSVYKSFFARYGDGQFDERTRSWDDLWSLLTLMTLRKCFDRAEYFRAQCRNIAQEAPLPSGVDSSAGGSWEPIDRAPTPEEALLLTDTVQEVLGGLAPNDHSIIELSLQGYTTEEISQQLPFSKRTVWRVRERLRKQLQRMQEE
jgi:RNA polymerase sigma-70 factor (ECF subfamily)